MARGRKSTTGAQTKLSDYRHSSEKRANIPPARIAAEGEVPKVARVKYAYNPHLPPVLRFDPTGKADATLASLHGTLEKAPLKAAERDAVYGAVGNHQPWLEWAGKREEHERGFFDVDPVALHIHERVSAQAAIRMAMREDIQRDLFADPQLPYQEAVKFYRHDVDWANRLILGDSLQVMSSLARRENLAGKVQMIFFDPPYGIKFASNFQPEVGRRDVKEKEQDLTREPEMVKAYRDTWQLGVHSYLSYLRDRLIEARELLAETGSIFVQISDENFHRVRLILDDVFSSQNYAGTISFSKTSSQTARYLASTSDFLLWYAKDLVKMKYKTIYGVKQVGGEAAGMYQFVEEQNGNRRRLTTDELAEGPEPELQVFRLGDVTSQRQGRPSGEGSAMYFPVLIHGRSYLPPGERGWTTKAEGMCRLTMAERLASQGERLAYVRYFDDFIAYEMGSTWTDTAGTQNRMYVVQTTERIVERCLLMTTDPGDLVLDPTSGSGTTAYVAEQWGRRWITIDTSRVAVSIARQRLLTAKYDYYRLREEAKGVAGSFRYKSVPHITLKSIAQNRNLDPIFAKHEPILEEALVACNAALGKVTDAAGRKLAEKLRDKLAREGKRAVTDADRRRWELPGKFEHWTVPFDIDPDCPKDLADTITAYRKVWRAKMDEINACISANADQEELVDQPEVMRGTLRVSGPFTVEGVMPEELNINEEGLFDGTPNEFEEEAGAPVVEVRNLNAYLTRMVQSIRADGLTFLGNKFRKFARVEPLFETGTGSLIHAEGSWEDGDESGQNSVAIAFGPQYGPVSATQVEELIRASRRYNELVIAGFSFDAEASAVISENPHPKLRIHQAYIRPDINPGMDGLLKETPRSQLFTVFGQPEIAVKQTKDGEWIVTLEGVDIYDPVQNTIRSTGAEKVAAWFLDADFDGRCFCISQAFFPDQDAWAKIAKALGSQADEEAFDAFKGTKSLPFPAGKHHRIAVKVVDPRGNEVMAIRKLEG